MPWTVGIGAVVALAAAVAGLLARRSCAGPAGDVGDLMRSRGVGWSPRVGVLGRRPAVAPVLVASVLDGSDPRRSALEVPRS